MNKNPPRRRYTFVLAGLAMLVCSVVAGPVASTAAAPTTGQPSPETGGQWLRTVAPAESYDAVDIRIDVAPDGSAVWQVEYRYDLPSDAAVRGFERTQENITNPPGAFITQFEENVVAEAESRTGRSMRLENGQVRTDLDVTAREGIVVYQFRWTNFAASPSEEEVVAGDAIAGYDLGPDESLMIEWPDRLERATVSPDSDFDQPNAIRWAGPVKFRTEDPTVVLQVASGGPGGPPVLLAVLAVGIVVLVVAGWYGRARWQGEQRGTDAGQSQAEAGTGQPQAASDAGQPQAEASTAQQEGDSDQPPPDLLSDEERVLRLLEEHGGRMKQQDLIDAVDWSRTKASDVVNEMHRNDQIELFRLGRENVLALPGEIEI